MDWNQLELLTKASYALSRIMTVPALADILVFYLLKYKMDTNEAAEFLRKFLLKNNNINVCTIAEEFRIMMEYEGSTELLSILAKLA